jgi:hypothetical protein
MPPTVKESGGSKWRRQERRRRSRSFARGRAIPPGVDTQVRLSTRNAEADHADLRARGVDVDAEVMSYPVPMFIFRDPDGNRLVIVERD